MDTNREREREIKASGFIYTYICIHAPTLPYIYVKPYYKLTEDSKGKGVKCQPPPLPFTVAKIYILQNTRAWVERRTNTQNPEIRVPYIAQAFIGICTMCVTLGKTTRAYNSLHISFHDQVKWLPF